MSLKVNAVFSRCYQGRHPLLNAIKNELLNPKVDYAQPQPVPDTPNEIDEDLEDIEVRPVITRPKPTTSRPIKQTTPYTTTTSTTTKKPKPPVIMDEEEQYKVVCYYTNWAWYR